MPVAILAAAFLFDHAQIDAIRERAIELFGVVIAPRQRCAVADVVEEKLAHPAAKPLVDRHAEADLRPLEDFLRDEPLAGLARDGQLSCYLHDGFWQPMDTLRDKRLLEELWAAGNAPWTRPAATNSRRAAL